MLNCPNCPKYVPNAGSDQADDYYEYYNVHSTSLVSASVGEQKLDFALSICIQNGWENEMPKYLVGMFVLGKTQNF